MSSSGAGTSGAKRGAEVEESGVRPKRSKASQHLECPVCYSDFDDEERRPKMLPACGHSVCAACTERLRSGRRIACPICREEGRIGAKGLPTNYSLVGLIQAKPNAPESEPRIACEDCEASVLLGKAWLCLGTSKSVRGDPKCEEGEGGGGRRLCSHCGLQHHRSHRLQPLEPLVAAETKTRKAATTELLAEVDESAAALEAADRGLRDMANYSAYLDDARSLLKELDWQGSVLRTRLGESRAKLLDLATPASVLAGPHSWPRKRDQSQRPASVIRSATNEARAVFRGQNQFTAILGELQSAATGFAHAIEAGGKAVRKLATDYDIPSPPATPIASEDNEEEESDLGSSFASSDSELDEISSVSISSARSSPYVPYRDSVSDYDDDDEDEDGFDLENF